MLLLLLIIAAAAAEQVQRFATANTLQLLLLLYMWPMK